MLDEADRMFDMGFEPQVILTSSLPNFYSLFTIYRPLHGENQGVPSFWIKTYAKHIFRFDFPVGNFGPTFQDITLIFKIFRLGKPKIYYLHPNRNFLIYL